MKTLVMATSVLAAGLLFGGGSAALPSDLNEYIAHCTFRTKAITLAIMDDDSNSSAAISVNGGPDVHAWREHATDGAGWLIHENDTPTIWFAGGARRPSSVLLQGKWYPLQCTAFERTVVAGDPAPAPTYTPPPAPALTYAPAPMPTDPSPAGSGGDIVKITTDRNGVRVPITLGDTFTYMILDTGANVSSINESLADQLIARGQAKELDPVEVTLAGGSKVTERTLSINKLIIGQHTRYGVVMTIVKDDADMLLGLPVLNAIGRFTIDAGSNQLIFS
jgi:hypothetical protein